MQINSAVFLGELTPLSGRSAPMDRYPATAAIPTHQHWRRQRVVRAESAQGLPEQHRSATHTEGAVHTVRLAVGAAEHVVDADRRLLGEFLLLGGVRGR